MGTRGARLIGGDQVLFKEAIILKKGVIGIAHGKKKPFSPVKKAAPKDIHTQECERRPEKQA